MLQDQLRGKRVRGRLYFLSPPDSNFQDIYLAVRKIESRLYADEEVRQLPFVLPDHRYFEEWRLRQKSFRRLLGYLGKQSVKGPWLDLGCGNGWLTHHLAELPATEVLGLDKNLEELEQAARLFSNDHCYYAYGDIFEVDFPGGFFERIILSSVIQYFPSLSQLIKRLLDMLMEKGEIHLLDSPVYSEADIPGAKKRTLDYYRKLEMEEMAKFYHHHSWQDLHSFSYEIHYPRRPLLYAIRQKLGYKDMPFPWICIRKENLD
jgi:SAM-dependent methyltransferase